jgi:hypothetical protein
MLLRQTDDKMSIVDLPGSSLAIPGAQLQCMNPARRTTKAKGEATRLGNMARLRSSVAEQDISAAFETQLGID